MSSVLTCAAIALAEAIDLPGEWTVTLLDMIEYIPTVTLVPRFIIGLRRVFACDIRGRRGSEIDTAFGSTSISGRGIAPSTILFADAKHCNMRLEQDDDEVQMEEIHSTGGSGYRA